MVGETGIVNLFHLSCCLVIGALELGCLVVSLLANQSPHTISLWSYDAWFNTSLLCSP